MKIAIYWMSKDYGGVDTHLLLLLRYWPNKKDEFLLYVNEDNAGYDAIKSKLCEIPNIKIIKVFSGWGNNSLSSKIMSFVFFPIYFYYLKFKTVNELKNNNIDALFVQNGGYPGSWKALASLWGAYKLNIKKRLLLIHHGSVHNNIIHRFGENLIDYKMSTWATDIVTVSRATRKTLIDYRGWDPYRNPIRVIHNGFEISNEERLNLNFRKTYNIATDSFIIGMVGRIDRYKGQEDLLIALSELPDQIRNNYTAVFVGTDGGSGEAKRLKYLSEKLNVSKQVVFTGFIEGEIKNVISNFNILAMLTKDFEGFGLTIGEAMVSNIPVICTDVGAVKEFVDNNVAWIIPPEDPSSLASLLTQYHDSNLIFKEKAESAKIHIKKWDAKVMAKRFYRIIAVE
jgi:glycosyltransferase involved in cell wall biosynthesis